jgi:hypothetical protein
MSISNNIRNLDGTSIAKRLSFTFCLIASVAAWAAIAGLLLLFGTELPF